MQISSSQASLSLSPIQTGSLAQNSQSGSITDGFVISDVLTANDKKLTGYDTGGGHLNSVVIALAMYRHSGALVGELNQSFIDRLRASIQNEGGFPSDPASLMAGPTATSRPASASLSPNTLGAILAIVNSSAESKAWGNYGVRPSS